MDDDFLNSKVSDLKKNNAIRQGRSLFFGKKFKPVNMSKEAIDVQIDVPIDDSPKRKERKNTWHMLIVYLLHHQIF
jgi:hypothetical protein